MTTPVEQIISRGRSVRARRRLPVLAGTAATPENGTYFVNTIDGRRIHIGVVSAGPQCPLR